MIYSASKVSQYIIFWHKQRGLSVSHVKLQKLLYYVQGYALVKKEEPLFYENFQAWKHGPVIPEIYQDYKSYGSNALNVFGHPRLEINDEIIINDILENFSNYNAFIMAEQTHKETPWKAHIEFEDIIPQSEIKSFFEYIRDYPVDKLDPSIKNYYKPFFILKR